MKDDLPPNPFPNRVKAPSLDGGVGWLNTSGEITMKDLRGKVVLLDFWTYCCINCMHVLPDLKFLEEKYAREIVVIGVHSAKFDNEKESGNIRRAIQRYEIAHPVINDAEMTVWRKFGARAWPTLVLLDPEGYYCGYISGEGNRELLDVVLGKLIAYHRAKGTLDETPVHFELEANRLKPTPLRFPGKVLADEAGGRLFISDSNHNRIVISSLDGKLIDIIGSGRIGAEDGSWAEASFDHQQGMELIGNTLYVADTENHLIRTVDLEQKTVSTLAGTGKQARDRRPPSTLRETALNSPWDLLHVNGTLYIAMAGPHQIWAHTPGSDTLSVFAGSGREDILNGPRMEAALAQPSGLATDGKVLFVADSEGSAIRQIGLGKDGEVTTLVGASDLPQGRSLFEFGDVDGVGGKARLQHPLCVAVWNGTVLAADAYNHKIRQITFGDEGAAASTLLGTGETGNGLDPLQFNEPAGIEVLGDTLFIADTNNHRILKSDLTTGKTTEFVVQGLTPPEPPGTAAVEASGPQAEKVEPQAVAAGKPVQVEISVTLPEEYKLNALYPARWQVAEAEGGALVEAAVAGKRHKLTITEDGRLIGSLPLAATSGSSTLTFTVQYGYCREGKGGLCKLQTSRWEVPVTVGGDATDAVLQLKSAAE
ncbi:MAG: redoxin domain-containing protein [Planctomycetaceae bacterium]|nr:redoxin domain-containing protein [Planctomycetaceae bacterium]